MRLVMLPSGLTILVCEDAAQGKSLADILSAARERFPDMPPIMVVGGPLEIVDLRAPDSHIDNVIPTG